MREFTGWLLDLFEDPREGLILYFIDEEGERRRLSQSFPVTFYALGSDSELRALWRYLSDRPTEISLSRVRRMDVFKRQAVTALGVTVKNPYEVSRVFHQTAISFPHLEYADADLAISLRFAAQTGAFPLCRCRVLADEENRLCEIKVLEDAWTLKTTPIPLRTMTLAPNVAPNHARPRYLRVEVQGEEFHFDLQAWRPLLINLRALLARFDPDLLITDWGDTWLLPRLLQQSEKYHIPLGLNRETGRSVSWREERTYFSYGQIIYRGQQIHLFGAAISTAKTPCYGVITSLMAPLKSAGSPPCRCKQLPASRRARAFHPLRW